jgi:hypothetical protein
LRENLQNLDQKSPGPPGWGVDAAGQPPAHRKKKIAIPNTFNGMDMFKEWKRVDYQKKL